MARAERNEEKNVKNYNYEWQTDEEIVANAHTKMSFHGREETTLADIIGTDDAEVFRQAHKLWLKLKEAFNKEGADYDPVHCAIASWVQWVAKSVARSCALFGGRH